MLQDSKIIFSCATVLCHTYPPPLLADPELPLMQCNAGYRIGHVGDQNKHYGGLLIDGSMDAPLTTLEEVDLDTLAYDLEDVRRLQV